MKYLILKSFIRQKKKLRKFCFIHAWLSFYQTRSRAQCCLIYSSITGVPHLCVNIGINVQRAERHLNILLFGHSQLWFHSFSSLVSVQFGECGCLLFRRDYQTSLSCLPTDLPHSMVPGFGSAWPDPKELLYTPVKSPKIAFALLWKPLGQLQSFWKEFSVQHCCADPVGNGKTPEDAEPHHPLRLLQANSGTAPLLMTKPPNNSVLFPACLGTIGSLITSES